MQQELERMSRQNAEMLGLQVLQARAVSESVSELDIHNIKRIIQT